MTDLQEIQRQIVERITAAPIGSWLRFKLMVAADAMISALEAEERALAAAGRHPLNVDSAAALRQGDRILINDVLVREFDRFDGGFIYATSSSLGHPPEHCIYLGPAKPEMEPAA